MLVSTLFCWFVSCLLYLMLFYMFSFSFSVFLVFLCGNFRIIGIVRAYTTKIINMQVFFIFLLIIFTLHL